MSTDKTPCTHSSTVFPPNELLFCTPIRGISNLGTLLQGSSGTVEQLAENLKNARDEARDAIALAKRKQKRYADDSRKQKSFQPGDLAVLKYNRFGPGYKLLPEHKRKLAPVGNLVRILERLSPLSYRIDLPSGSRIHDVVSVVHLREFKGVGNGIRPLSNIADEFEKWEAERIEGERVSEGVVEF